jgi:hypothetical protein
VYCVTAKQAPAGEQLRRISPRSDQWLIGETRREQKVARLQPEDSTAFCHVARWIPVRAVCAMVVFWSGGETYYPAFFWFIVQPCGCRLTGEVLMIQDLEGSKIFRLGLFQIH